MSLIKGKQITELNSSSKWYNLMMCDSKIEGSRKKKSRKKIEFYNYDHCKSVYINLTSILENDIRTVGRLAFI